MFQKFRNGSLKNFGLCLSQYLGTPGLSWDAMLNMTKLELELISDSAMYLFLEFLTFLRDTVKATISI